MEVQGTGARACLHPSVHEVHVIVVYTAPFAINSRSMGIVFVLHKCAFSSYTFSITQNNYFKPGSVYVCMYVCVT